MAKKIRVRYGNLLLTILVVFLLIYGLVSIFKFIFKDDDGKNKELPIANEENVLPEAEGSGGSKITEEYTFNIGDSFEEVSSLVQDNKLPYTIFINYVKEPREGIVNIEENTLYFEQELTKNKVKWLQSKLTKAGYPTRVDGGFGKNTKKALDQYTSEVMNQKFDHFNSAVEESLELITDNIEDKITLTKEKVKWLQEYLKIAGYYTKIDGNFGKNTQKTLDEYTTDVMGGTFATYNDDIEDSLKEYTKDKLADTTNYYLMIVNKKKNILSTFRPIDLVDITANHSGNVKYIDRKTNKALVKMFADAKEDGITLRVVSGYRSFDYQVNLFDKYVRKDGYEKANKYSALPGQSEHQTGLAVDVDNNSDKKYTVSVKFEETDAFKWLTKNAYKYGFILRYPKGKEDITGYSYEPWHYRYVGDIDIAKEISDNNLTLEEYMNK